MKPFLAIATLIASWYLMEAVHELAHVAGALGRVEAIHLPILGISSTAYATGGPSTPAIAAGPILGALAPLVLLLIGRSSAIGRLGRFFSGFCLVANGVYLSAGVLIEAGDTADLLARGMPMPLLIVVGMLLTAGGLLVWHGNGRWAGLVPNKPMAVT